MAIQLNRFGARRRWRPWAWFWVWFLLSIAWGQSDSEREAVIKKVEPSVAKVVIELEQGMGHGSGYIVDESGLVVTNAHVVKIASTRASRKIYVTFPADGDKKEYIDGGLLGRFADQRPGPSAFQDRGKESACALKLAEKLPSQGETVFTFGSPLGWDNTIAFGW